jgi:hypothetical protein
MKRHAHRRARLFVPCLALLAAHAAAADTLVGRRGERIPGHVVEEKDGQVTFASDSFGRLQVPAADVTIERDATTPAAATGPPSAAPRWTVDIGARVGVDRGTLEDNEETLDASLRLQRVTARGELRTTLDYRYKRTEGELKDDDLSASLSYDRLASAHRFTAARAHATSEHTDAGADFTRSVSITAGWRLWEGPRRYLRVGPSLGYLELERSDARFDGVALGAFARGRAPLAGHLDVEGEVQLLDSFRGGRYATLEARLRHDFGEHLYVALAWNYLWSDVEIESGLSSQWRWVLGWRTED